MQQTTTEDKKMKSLRFGGISPVVLRELSGVYQPFVKAIKELISNAYDADAEKVELYFEDDYQSLRIEDNGCGMNPIEFIRDYIRIGKSIPKEEHTAKLGRPRIGGKGIGFLAPARYCDIFEVKTKKQETTIGKIVVELVGSREVNLAPYLLQGHDEEVILKYITVNQVTDLEGNSVQAKIKGVDIEVLEDIEVCQIWYTFDSSNIELTARINFASLFSLDSNKSLEDINNFCEINIEEVSEELKEKSYTKLTLVDIKDFVRQDLLNEGKRGARNIESFSGIEQFRWNLSRIIPVKSNLHKHLPEEIKQFIRNDMDGEDKGHPIHVTCSINGEIPETLERFVIQPEHPMTLEHDIDLIKRIKIGDEQDDFIVRGFLIGQSSTIYPAESRGILMRVKGVAVGEPTYFGLDQILTGASKVALSLISGEINIIKGMDAIEDINPGRDGFYKESKQYNRIKEFLIGDNPEKLIGDLKDLIDAIILRSEINASMQNFLKRYDSQRKAIVETSMAIGEMAYEEPEIIDRFFSPSLTNELSLCKAVQYKADGKLATYTVELSDSLNETYKIDYVNKRLLLNKNDDMWRKNININGVDFQLILKHGKQSKVFCEVNPKSNSIYINWDHPMRGTMGENSFIKHCLATVASAIPQEQLSSYVRLMTHKV
ncbi:ATP-binding protein [Aneurinibacillus terranovensis]|uniref:ATP-binding protein n=1 Tax=Aneurinibacillus terranovensis TaxID=278991 RepID=UPI0004199FBF|nr:ATP-binding protein [Aneurinibacillus terranovensis]